MQVRILRPDHSNDKPLDSGLYAQASRKRRQRLAAGGVRIRRGLVLSIVRTADSFDCASSSVRTSSEAPSETEAVRARMDREHHSTERTACYVLHSGRRKSGVVMDLSQVRAICEAAMREYGVPARIRTDNGAPFAGTGLLGLSKLSLGWMKAWDRA